MNKIKLVLILLLFITFNLFATSYDDDYKLAQDLQREYTSTLRLSMATLIAGGLVIGGVVAASIVFPTSILGSIAIVGVSSLLGFHYMKKDKVAYNKAKEVIRESFKKNNRNTQKLETLRKKYELAYKKYMNLLNSGASIEEIRQAKEEYEKYYTEYQKLKEGM